MGILTYDEKNFLMDGEPFIIRSGSIHYFRVVPEYWEDRMKKLKACGFNTIETYTCWNLHERKEGEFDFSGMLDIEKFIQIAHKLDLFVILRPGPYICAEFDFGGLPSWLLRYPKMRIRCHDALFLEKVARYYKELFLRLTPHLTSNGGNIMAVQIENEYGSYGNDKKYLQAIVDIYRENQVDCLLFTSDGGTDTMLTGGTLPDYLATLNFGGHVKDNFAKLREHRPEQPLLCCEFWNGWFDHWYEEHHCRQDDDVLDALEELFEEGASVNFYMFHGGTNFGFTNGANHIEEYAPTITSYDYDCPLNECGDMTSKYDAVKSLLEEYFGVAEHIEVHNLPKKAYGIVKLTEQAPLLQHVDKLSTAVHATYPMSMEELNQDFGFVLYSTLLQGPIEETTLHLDGMHDRAQIFLDGRLAGIKETTGKRNDEIKVQVDWNKQVRLDILVENLGRVNYGAKIWEEKGIVGGVRLNNRYEFEWDMFSITCEHLDKLPFSPCKASNGEPVFLRGNFEVSEKADTFLRLDGFAKGVVILNGFNLGRYWNAAGPQKTLYIPAPVLKEGCNELIIFELEGYEKQEVVLTDVMDLG